MKKYVALLILLLLTLSSFFGCGENNDKVSESSSSSSSTSGSAVKPITGKQIGETQKSVSNEVSVTAAGKLTDKTPSNPDSYYFYVDIKIKNISSYTQDMTIMQRFHLLNSLRKKTTVESFTASDGTDLSSKKLMSGDEAEGRALFAVPNDFEIAAFTYTYDINGFGVFTYLIGQ